ncbi:MAG: hypothetical protein P1U56_05285 [Saprospiraceae bacterium]|nr:hypothetical protein [Saprospiraceae bacterium]
MKPILPYLILLLCLGSCSEPTIILDESDLLGEWWGENSHVNGSPISEFIDGAPFYSHILGLKEDNFYFLDYSSGEWNLENNELVLSNWGEFKITSYTDSLFTMEGEIIAGQLFWQLKGIEKEETILFKEDYRRR